MTCQDLRKIQSSINFDAPSMADCLGITVRCYYNYLYGVNSIPTHVERAALKLEHINAAFMSRYQPGGEFDRELDRKYPHGIPSVF